MICAELQKTEINLNAENKRQFLDFEINKPINISEDKGIEQIKTKIEETATNVPRKLFGPATGPSTSSAYPLLTPQFYSIYNILYSVNDKDFEDTLVANTITSLTKVRVDGLKFSIPDVDENLHAQLYYSHDLLIRIDDIFRFMVKLAPKVRKTMPHQAAIQAINFLYKYYIEVVEKSEKWIEVYAVNFASRLSQLMTTSRVIPIDHIEIYLEWLCYLWAVMEFYAIQFERYYFGIEKDKLNPFSHEFQLPSDTFRPLECVDRLLETVFRPQMTTDYDKYSSRCLSTSGRDSGIPEDYNGRSSSTSSARNAINFNFNLVINFGSE